MKLRAASVALGLSLASLALAQEKKGGVAHVGPLGPPSMRCDLVILGDGYTKDDFGPRGPWEVDTARLVKNFFEKEPFKEQRALFNVHLVECISLDKGVDADDGPARKNTAFKSRYGVSKIDRLLAPRDEAAVRAAVDRAPGCEMILILVNDQKFGGSGGKLESTVPLSVCSTESTAFLTAIHELGHSFAGLGDEYADPPTADKYPLPDHGDLKQPNLTLAKYVDTSSPDNLVKTLKWSRFFRSPGAFKDLGKGWYEGGYYREKGVYRPAQQCAMQTEAGGGGFCYVCRDEMTKAILRASGRNERGRFAGPDVPARVAPSVEVARELYLEGRYAKALAALKKVESNAKASADEKSDAAAIAKAIEDGLAAGLARVEELAARDKAAAREYFALFDEAFKGTSWAKQAQAASKQLK
jgi:hypothetical protein